MYRAVNFSSHSLSAPAQNAAVYGALKDRGGSLNAKNQKDRIIGRLTDFFPSLDSTFNIRNAKTRVRPDLRTPQKTEETGTNSISEDENTPSKTKPPDNKTSNKSAPPDSEDSLKAKMAEEKRKEEEKKRKKRSYAAERGKVEKASTFRKSLKGRRVFLDTSSPSYRTIKRSLYPDLRTGQKFRVTYDSFRVGSKRKIRFVPEKKLRNQSDRERSGIAANFNVIA